MNKIYWRQRFCSADLLEFSHWLMWVNLGWISFVTGIPIMSLMLISSSPWSSIASSLHIISTSWAFPGPQYPSCSDHSEERERLLNICWQPCQCQHHSNSSRRTREQCGGVVIKIKNSRKSQFPVKWLVIIIIIGGWIMLAVWYSKTSHSVVFILVYFFQSITK